MLRKNDYPDGRFTLAFVATATKTKGGARTHSQLDHANTIWATATAMSRWRWDSYKACEEVKKLGGKVTREAGPMKHAPP